MSEHYDVVVIGAGTAGSIVTRRMIDRGRSVLLLEAGGYDTNPAIHDLSRVVELWHGPEDWDYYTVPQEHAAGRRLHLPRGKVVGGSHSLNATIWVRGVPGDYDGWAAQGAEGWGWSDVLPVFKAIENYDGGPSALRGTGGPIDVVGDYELSPINRAILDAAVEWGLPHNPDYNGPSIDGVAREQVTLRDGRRFSTYSAYVRPIEDHAGLTVRTGAWVHRLLWDGTRAVGAEYEREGALTRVTADTIVLSSGAIDTPRVLLRSGVGPADELRALGIDVVIDLPGVGRNLHDHVCSPVIFTTEARVVELPPPGVSVSQVHMFWRSQPHLPGPDTQPIAFGVPMYEPWMTGPGHGFTITAGIITPKSRGSVTLTGPDPHDPLAIDLRALEHPDDVAALVASVRQAREIGRQPALADAWGARELYPGPEIGDDEVEDYVRRTAITYHHQVGTARLGVDGLAVVDPALRVHGTEGLRVIDASVMPTVISGNTNAPTAMIAERGAAILASRR